MAAFHPLDVVRFVDPVNAAEESARFVVLEDRGDRLLVAQCDAAVSHMAIKPTQCLAIEHFRPA